MPRQHPFVRPVPAPACSRKKISDAAPERTPSLCMSARCLRPVFARFLVQLTGAVWFFWMDAPVGHRAKTLSQRRDAPAAREIMMQPLGTLQRR